MAILVFLKLWLASDHLFFVSYLLGITALVLPPCVLFDYLATDYTHTNLLNKVK
jgi:hypothetical protein